LKGTNGRIFQYKEENVIFNIHVYLER
jgi:hypothetical protein